VEVKWALMVERWKLSHPDKIGLLDVVHNVLIGVSGQAEPIVRAIAECNKRPVVFPPSNPTSREEATVADIEAWTEGRTLIGVGSPFPPIMRDSSHFNVDQTNNSYIFPVSASVTITVWLCPAVRIHRACMDPYDVGSRSLRCVGIHWAACHSRVEDTFMRIA
jgi:malic enzyme